MTALLQSLQDPMNIIQKETITIIKVCFKYIKVYKKNRNYKKIRTQLEMLKLWSQKSL